MIVDKMTEKELVKELLEDFNSITRSLVKYIPMVNREVKKNRNKIPFNVMYKYVSPLKNNWLLYFRIFHKHFTKPNKCIILNVMLHETSHGTYAYHVDLKKKVAYSKFTPHFFKRYAERFGVNLHGKELITHFFYQNIHFPINELRDKQDMPYLVGCFDDGVGLGCITEEGNYLFKTFITYDLAKGNQILRFEALDFIRQCRLNENFHITVPPKTLPTIEKMAKRLQTEEKHKNKKSNT